MTSVVGVQPEPSDQYVQSFVRGLEVIRAFDADHARMSLSEISTRTGLTRATARRFLHTLLEIGYVRVDDKAFSLTPRVLELGFSYLSSLRLPDIAQPHLEAFADETGESSSMAILDGADIVYVARAAVRRIMSVSISVGTRFPAYATAMGRVMLSADRSTVPGAESIRVITPRSIATVEDLVAELDIVASQGYSLVDEELELGLRSIAVPVRHPGGTTLAAINVSVSTGSYSVADLRGVLLPRLREASLRIENEIR